MVTNERVRSWEGADVGELTSLRVWHDGSGDDPSWHLDMVEIVVTEVCQLTIAVKVRTESDSACSTD